MAIFVSPTLWTSFSVIGFAYRNRYDREQRKLGSSTDRHILCTELMYGDPLLIYGVNALMYGVNL